MEVLRKAFSQKLDDDVSAFVNCVEDDEDLIAIDIAGSLAHSQMLAQSGLLTSEQAINIQNGLQQLRTLYASGELTLKAEFEDVHMNVEKQLEVLIGPDALRLHTARSRNDQVALDLRLYVCESIDKNIALLKAFQTAFVDLASANLEVVMPGYTHLQRAQPVLFSHVMLAFVAMLGRDAERFTDARKRANISPLGAAALSGTSLPVNPALSAALLGMNGHFVNSMDAVSDRDFIVEYLSACALASVHISQIAETFILWATSEFGFVSFGDDVTTASSLMPNKKNPDPLELARAKSGTACGDLVNVLMVLKSLPLGYNRDLQDTKTPMLRTTKSLQASVKAMIKVLASTKLNSVTMKKAASDPFVIATDLVEYLVNKGVPFRTAHEQVSALLSYCRNEQIEPDNLTLEQMRSFSSQFDSAVFSLFNASGSANAKTSPGGTASTQVMSVLIDQHYRC